MNEHSESLPDTQYAVQLVGPSELRLNREKPVHKPNDYQIVGKIEAVGLCFSDLKLLKQFTEHARKSEIISGIDQAVLAEIPSYVPGTKPAVPGHEGVCRILAVGEKVKHHKVGERCLVQADYRSLRTADANGAFGYNFEGALEEYALFDERVVMDPKTGQRYLIPVGEELGSSAVCLVEPWACVEDSYVTHERRTLKAGGQMLLVVDEGHEIVGLNDLVAADTPEKITAFCHDETQLDDLNAAVEKTTDLTVLPDEAFDDIVYFGTDKATIELLNDKLAGQGIINIVTGGKTIGEPVSVGVGRLHYGMTRWIGTRSTDAGDAYASIPETGELRFGDVVNVIGAGGPMGQMHVIRDVCSGVENLTLYATDLDDDRLEILRQKTESLARERNVDLRIVNTKKEPLDQRFSYFALMAPVAALVAAAIKDSTDRCLINIFAGIPAPVKHELDLDTYIANRCYMFGTSGSEIRDMKIVLEKVESGQLDTNISVGAVSGMAGATDGIAAVENRTMPGKIIVYPMLHEMPLIPLSELGKTYPTVADKLDDGKWTQAAEAELLKVART